MSNRRSNNRLKPRNTVNGRRQVIDQADSSDALGLAMLGALAPDSEADRHFLLALYARNKGDGNSYEEHLKSAVMANPRWSPLRRGFYMQDSVSQGDPLFEPKMGFRSRHPQYKLAGVIDDFERLRAEVVGF